MKTASWMLPLSLLSLAALVPSSGCSSNKNHEEREATPEAQAGVDPSHPELTDPVAQQEARKAECISTCLPDNDSGPVDCAEQEAGLEFYWAWDLQNASNKVASATYSYDDLTTDFLVPERDAWEPAADPVTRCKENPNNFAVRFKGGRFVNYGGGFGKSFCTSTSPCDKLPPSEEFPGMAVDLSSFDGIALWARRGPNSIPTLRVGVTEKHSAEDLNTGSSDNPEAEGKYCQRFRLCGCPAGTPCTATMAGTEYCWDPELSDAPAPDAELCGKSRCEEFNTTLSAPDPLFAGRACSDAIQSDGLTAKFCYDPGEDPTPPAKRERCGNPFVYPVTIPTRWTLITVPWSELRQADEAAVADEFDLKSIRQLIFTHSTGWTDFYVSDVGFYRRL